MQLAESGWETPSLRIHQNGVKSGSFERTFTALNYFFAVHFINMRKLFLALRGILPRCACFPSASASTTPSVVVSRKVEQVPSDLCGPGGYLLINTGDVFNERYKTVQQIGWGTYSMVWIVQDLQLTTFF